MMDLTFHYLLLASQAMVQKELLEQLSDTPLSMGQPKVLDFLKDHDGANQTEIAKGCHIEPPTLSLILRRMEEGGLIERRSEPNNRRTLYVYLTEKGGYYQNQVADVFSGIEEEIFRDFTEAEKARFMDSYAKIYRNLMRKRGLA
jgi:DNA-binding MarR family transcriptional regulator